MEIRGATLADFEAAVAKVSADYDGNLVVHRDSYQSGSLARGAPGLAAASPPRAGTPTATCWPPCSTSAQRPASARHWPSTAGERASSGTTPRRPTSTWGARCSPRTCPSHATAEGRKQVGGLRAALSVVWARLSAASCGSLLLLVSFLALMAAEQ